MLDSTVLRCFSAVAQRCRKTSERDWELEAGFSKLDERIYKLEERIFLEMSKRKWLLWEPKLSSITNSLLF